MRLLSDDSKKLRFNGSIGHDYFVDTGVYYRNISSDMT